jgi:hypothetical protein
MDTALRDAQFTLPMKLIYSENNLGLAIITKHEKIYIISPPASSVSLIFNTV